MSCSHRAYASHNSHAHSEHCGRMRWKPIELLAMILGFILFWPAGLAILGWKIFQAKTAYAGDFGQFAQEKWGGFEKRSGLGAMARNFSAEWPASSGNSAFDDYRAETLKKLEDEQREFTSFLDRLRRAKDKAEFDQFMTERGTQPPGDAQKA